MSEEPLSDPRVHAAARGVVTQLMTHHNSAGRPWVTFTLQTSAGSMPCMCFPSSLESLGTEIERDEAVIVHGQVTAGDDLEIRVLELKRPSEDS